MFPLANVSDSVDPGWDEFFQWVPKLVGFLVIVLIGYIVAKVVGNLVARALKRAGFDRLLERGAGGSYVMRVVKSPSSLLGTLSFWAVFLGALSIAVDVLGITALEDLGHHLPRNDVRVMARGRERATMLAVLEEPPDSLSELRGVLTLDTATGPDGSLDRRQECKRHYDRQLRVLPRPLPGPP